MHQFFMLQWTVNFLIQFYESQVAGYVVTFNRAGPAILDWYTGTAIACAYSVNKLGGSGGMLPHENFFSEIASEAMFGPKCY